MKLFSNDWQGSTAHIILLLQFTQPVEPVDGFNEQDWDFVLGEPLERAITRLKALHYLDTIPLHTHLELMTVKELKDILTKLELPLSGNKPDLIGRLLNDTDLNHVAVLAPRKKLVLTSFGEKLIDTYRNDKERIKRELEALPSAAELAERSGDKLGPADGGRQRMTKEWVKDNLTWISKEVIVGGIVSAAAYDILKAQWPTIVDVIQAGWNNLRRTQVTPSIGIEWCHVPAGEFWMGAAPHDKQARDNEKPRHKLYLPSFYMAKYPVTNVLYQVFINELGSKGDDLPYLWRKSGRYPSGKKNHPITYVSHFGATAFCRWLSLKVNADITLPTEAQWEKAARGTDQRIYPWGNRWSPDMCNHEDSGFADTVDVDRYSRNVSPYGCVGMVGNMYEWTNSIYKPYPYVAGDGRENPTVDDQKTVKGGSYYINQEGCRASFRRGYLHSVIGFRVCVSAPSSTSGL